jgi:hypothetical protein
MTLDDAIAQEITLGEKDPLTIARKIQKKLDDHWLAKELLSLAEEIVSDRARQRLGSQRQSSMVALRPGDHIASSELRLRSVWVPGKGWTRAADMTDEDCDAVSRFYLKLASASTVRAIWYATVADMIRVEGVKTLGRLKAALPALPAGQLESA